MKPADTGRVTGSTAVVRLVAAGSLVAFVLLTLIVTGHDGAPLIGDTALTSWSLAHRPDVALALARGVTYTGTGVVPYTLVVVAGLVLGRTARQRVRTVTACVCCLAVAQAVRFAVMSLVARPRPPMADWATHASGWSFPSGHTTTSAVTGGLLVLAVLSRAPRCERTLVLLSAGWAVLVGLSRVYLGVHWFSDVLGGWLFALCWLSLFTYVGARFLPGVHSVASAPRLHPGPPEEEGHDGPDDRRDLPPDSASRNGRAPRSPRLTG
ncbi:phosphatase PAP2 family protein [Streptomyces sp. NBC_00638]|uniref:phosphatase PAP2 family protein n=1 Tax=unclassified Streptomyces TaxID=2593676 RepID=UPI00224CA6D7|nr:phosphatase PAP2 family protein [Streptomyces sp. NBC_00638]MCX5001628.1 phosphatase PAP2 family protein [Streptomyces sp. NBC_00638]